MCKYIILQIYLLQYLIWPKIDFIIIKITTTIYVVIIVLAVITVVTFIAVIWFSTIKLQIANVRE